MYQKQILRISLYLSLFFVSVLSAETTVLEDISEGKRLFVEKKYSESIQAFRLALSKNKNSLDAKLGLADNYAKLNANQESKKYYKEILVRETKHIPASIGLAEVLLAEGNTKQVSELLTPLLTEYPNNTGLRIVEAKLALKEGRIESSILKLKNVSARLGEPSDIVFTLANLYFQKEKYLDAIEQIESYTKKEPADPNGFSTWAKILLYQNYFYPRQMVVTLPQIEELIDTSLSLDPEHEESRYLMALVGILQANLQKDNNFKTKSFRTVYALAKEFPENIGYHSLEADLAWDVGEYKFSHFHYRRALQQNDLNEVLRWEAEVYSIENSKEESQLRRELGEYRKERFEAEKFSLYHKSSIFHLLRARDLIPQTPSLRKDLLEYYNNQGFAVPYANLLLKLKEEDPTAFSLQNKLEFTIQSLKNALEYKEDYLKIEQDRIQLDTPNHLPEVYVFDLESITEFPTHRKAGRLLSQALRFQLSQMEQVRIVKKEEYNQIRQKMADGRVHPFSESIPFTVDSLYLLDTNRKNSSKIRFVVHGKYKYENDELFIHVFLYDRLLQKDIGDWKTSQKGRDSLSAILQRLGAKIKLSLPIEGKILKIKKDDVLISLGKFQGLSVGQGIRFVRNGSLITEGKISELGSYISLVKPVSRDWSRLLATGDLIQVTKPNP